MDAPGLRALTAGLAVIIGLSACGSAPPDPSSLLKQSSQRMEALKGFRFSMTTSGFSSSSVPVQSASGDARPPDLRANVNLQEGGLLLEVQVIFAAGGVYLKSFTGGWQQLTADQLAQFFDARTLFDPKAGLFPAMRDTTAPYLGKTQAVSGHDTYPIDGALAGTRVHQLLAPIRDQGSYHVTYWIERDNADLWRARLSGNLFDASQSSTVTFDFSNHDHPVSVSPPPIG
ncbi:MAG TPA: LppX_LprAFG lipoprotein [Candidatus Dormibacteraeota bacterium]|jgi:lipoprotein LprG|nr:LppX_LprAFG lipoprotein [Candidatus Dormibacteraeota bacterium]